MNSRVHGSEDALAELTYRRIKQKSGLRILIGGLGMGFTLREVLDLTGPRAVVEVAEFVPEIVDWNRGALGGLAGDPLSDPRTDLWVVDVAERIGSARNLYDAILLDVDNGPDSLAHARNEALYGIEGITRVRDALVDRGVLGVWSFSDDAGFTRRLEACGFHVSLQKIAASRKGRGKHHFVWIATKGGSPG